MWYMLDRASLCSLGWPGTQRLACLCIQTAGIKSMYCHAHLLYFEGSWLLCILFLGTLGPLKASEPSSIPECLCNQLCVLFLFQLSHFYHQNEAVKKKRWASRNFLKRKKNLAIQFFSAKILSCLWLLSKQSQMRQKNQSRETHVETWWKSACLVLLLVGPEVEDRECRSPIIWDRSCLSHTPVFLQSLL